MVREALEDRIPPARRRQLHRILLEHLMHTGDRSRSVLERLARHAAGCGESGLAADALIELAEEDRRRHRYVDAETHYSAALDQLTAGDPRREPILAGRGKVRYRLQRFQESLDDLQAARALSEARGDDAATADLLLEEATVLDWLYDWPESADRVQRVQPLIASSGHPRLVVRAQAARGRSLWRQERAREAVIEMSAAADQAGALGDHETHTIALLLLAPALAAIGRLDDSRARFEQAIRACQERGDGLHLCAAYTNRLVLWMKLQQIEEATLDQIRAITLARELGFSTLEGASTYNLAELLHWLGRDDEALPLATRALPVLQRIGVASTEGAVLLARILCELGERDRATALLESVRARVPAEEMSGLTRALVSLVELRIASSRGSAAVDDWEGVLGEVAACAVLDEHVEALHDAARWALERGHAAEARRWISRAAEIAGDSPIWRNRLLAVSSQTTN
jgi:tetratricopeptide (TPR) repeat protein